MMFPESMDNNILCAGAGRLGVYVQNLCFVPHSGFMVVGAVGKMLVGTGRMLAGDSASGGQLRSVLSGVGMS